MPAIDAERFERFFAATSDCQFYLKKGSDGRFRYVNANPVAVNVAGRSTESELVGLTPVEALGHDYGATVENNIAEAFRHGRPHHFHGALGSSGNGPVYDAAYIPLTDSDGEVVGVLGNARDVTEISLLNEQLLHAKKVEALGEISGSIAHDFNNVLAALHGVVHLLSNDSLDPRTRANILKEAGRTLENGTALTKRLTSFARKEKVQAVPHDIAELVTSCMFMVERVLGKRIKLRVDIPPNLWRACCDRNEFQIAMTNLATNARDAIENDGEVLISAENKFRSPLEPSHHPSEYVSITVRDTGCGMPPDIAKKAIDPFFSTKPDGKGTGLGLSAVVKFASDVGGGVRIESEVGNGTAVSILLARATA